VPDKPSTFETAVDDIATRADLDLHQRADVLYDLVYQVADEYIIGRRFGGDEVARQSLGKKLAYLEKDPNEELKKALKRFRAHRLKCERKAALTEDMIAALQAAASQVVRASGLGNREFISRVPIGTRTINSVSIDSPRGYRYFHILHADVFSVPADLTIISTHADPTTPPQGQLVNALQKRGISIDPTRILLVVDRDTMWTCFQAVGDHDTVRAVLTARMKTSRRLADPQAYFDTAIRGIFSSVASLEYLGNRFRTINLPVIYGQRIVDYQAAIESLLRHSLVWLRKSDYTESVNFVVYSSDELGAWNSAMNVTLGRSLVAAGSNEVLKGMTREVIEQLPALTGGTLSPVVEPLLQALSTPDRICVQNVCVFGRKLCELMCADLLRRREYAVSGDLCSNIERLRENVIVAPWICAYMHSLRIFGNETVHERSAAKYVPKSLDHNDLVAALSAVKSLLAFWRGQWAPQTP
jgi:hypothetical protein